MQDTLTQYGDSDFIRSFENIMTKVGKLTIKPVLKINIEQIKSYYPLGTTDGIDYTIIPRL